MCVYVYMYIYIYIYICICIHEVGAVVKELFSMTCLLYTG